jgi:hypothetical protein
VIGPDLDDMQVAAANIAAAGWPIGPRENPCTCGRPRHEHTAELEGCTGYEHDPADALAQAAAEADTASVLVDMAAYDDHLYAARHTDPANPRAVGPRVSDVGKCRRQVWYRETPPDDYTPRQDLDRRAASMGTAFHDKAARARAWRYPWRRYDMYLTVPGLDGGAYLDEYDPITGTVVEFKTCGEWKWEQVGDLGPADEQVDQAMIYGLALEQAGWPVNRIVILAVRRATGEEEPFWYLYDPERATRALDGLLALADSIELGITPPRDGNGPAGFPCRYCPAVSHCWQVDAAELAGRSPESWVALGDAPDDESVGWAAATVWELQRSHSGAKAAYDQAKKLLEGVPTGKYGEYEIANVERRMPEYKATHARNLGYWELDPDHRPPYEVVARPETRVDRYLRVSRVRAAARRRKAAELGPPLVDEQQPADEHLDSIA